MVLCAGYLMFYLGQMQLTWLSGMARLPDISYGIYLYGWPVESSVDLVFSRVSLGYLFCVSTVICFALGWVRSRYCHCCPAFSIEEKAFRSITRCLSVR